MVSNIIITQSVILLHSEMLQISSELQELGQLHRT